MFWRIVFVIAACLMMVQPADARRVALVIGQNAYPGGTSATVGLPSLDNPVLDARRMAELLVKRGFEVIACDGTTPGCFDLNRSRFLEALTKLEQRAAGADLALVFFAGHGMATEEGNILTPVDAKVNCATGVVTQGVAVERIMAATKPALHKLVILDACRDNPLGEVCPSLKGKKLSFTRIEAGALDGFLLVTSTQFGQYALDGLPGTHSPFATALFSALEANPSIYFEQVFNEVARATYEAAQKQDGFLQIPGKVVGGAAPTDCLAGKDCVGDVRMAALAIENERLTADAAGVRNLLAAEEQANGKPYTAEERKQRVAELGQTLARIGTSTDPLRQQGRRLIDQGNVVGGRAKLDEALDADEKAIAEAARVDAERRKAGARGARDLAVLARGTDVVMAVGYYQRATRLDPSDPQTWIDHGEAARDAGRSKEAKAAFEQAAHHARGGADPLLQSKATYRQGDVAKDQGDLAGARRLYEAALAIIEPLAKADPGNAGWQRELSVSQEKIGDVCVGQGNLAMALEAYRTSLAIRERLAGKDPDNAVWRRDLYASLFRIAVVEQDQGNLAAALSAIKRAHAIIEELVGRDPHNASWQRDLSMSHGRIGIIFEAQYNLAKALEHYKADLAIAERLAKMDSGNSAWQRDLSVSQMKIGDVLRADGDVTAALESYQASLAIQDRLAKADPGNAVWERSLLILHNKIGDLQLDQGNMSAALQSFRAVLAIQDRRAQADPSNAGWQSDLSASHDRIGDTLLDQGNLPGALESFRASLAIAERLAKLDPGNSGLLRNQSVSQVKIGDLLRVKGDLAAALASYRVSIAIQDRLAKADHANASAQHDLALGHGRIAAVLARQGSRSEAEKTYEQGHAIIMRLSQQFPDNTTFPRDLAWFDAQRAALKK